MEKNIVAVGENTVARFFYKTLDSTNTEARRYAMGGGSVPALFCADSQTAGRGRMGRSFYSPSGTGIYLSLLLEVTDDAPASVVKITSAAAVAVGRVIQRLTDKHTSIKWVNDIYLNGRKVCGILAESFFSDRKRFVVIGVGINLSTSDFPEELTGVAGSLGVDASEGLKQKMAVQICTELCGVYELIKQGDCSYMQEYRERSAVLGKRVTFTENGVSRQGVALSVDDSGGLEIACDGGERITLNSGEIKLRLTEGKI